MSDNKHLSITLHSQWKDVIVSRFSNKQLTQLAAMLR